jgi:hypothetical protein
MTNMYKLQRKIMRAIYYAYVIRVACTPGVWQGITMMVCIIALTYFVSIKNVLSNMSHIEISSIGVFMYNALRTTEVWTFLLVGIFVYALLSFRISIVSSPQDIYHHTRQTA